MIASFRYFLLNFAVPVVFFVTFRQFGARPAIGFAMVVILLQLLGHWLTRQRPTIYFVIAAVFTLCFGGIDVLSVNPRFFKLEPFAQNFIMGGLFLWTGFTDAPIIIRFIAALPAKLRHFVSDGVTHHYLRKLTFVWSGYFFLKAFFFLYLSFAVDLGSLIVLRSVIGTGTLLMLVVGELAFRKMNGRLTGSI